jgi:SAM-dependent methyltransferase
VKIYGELAAWWHVLSPPSDYAEEAASYIDAIEVLARGDVKEVLELGSGGGNNASFLKERYALTLTDLSEDMLAQSRKINPEAEHIQGDMRTLRLGRDFDAVLIHDAIMYMTTEQDLAAAIDTAAVHLRPGGVALFVPDDTAETYEPRDSWEGHAEGDRSVRYLMWYDPLPPGATHTTVTFVVVMREDGKPVRAVLDEHTFGLFGRETWLRLIRDAGLEPTALPYEHSDFDPSRPREMFAGIKP